MAEQEAQDQDRSLGERFANLFHRTWEMELLLFGFVLVGLWEVPDLLYVQMQKVQFFYQVLELQSTIVVTYFKFFLGILRLGVMIAILGMLIHLALRGFWIATIGLHSTFPEGMDLDKLKLNDRFRNFFAKRIKSLERFEKDLDDICSANFALTFLIFFTWWGIMASLLVMILFIFLFSTLILSLPVPQQVQIILLLITLAALFFFLVLYSIDFFTNGRIKRVRSKWIAVPYFYWYRFMSAITLSFLYRPIYYTFITRKTRKFLPALIGILCIAFFGFGGNRFHSELFFPTEFPEGQEKGSLVEPEHYASLIPDQHLIIDPIIPQKKVKEDQMKLFLPYRTFYDTLLQKRCPESKPIHEERSHFFQGIPLGRGYVMLRFDSESDNDSASNRRKILDCLSQRVDSVFIDSNYIPNLAFKFYRHPRNEIPGFLTYVPLAGLSTGWHELLIQEGREEETRIPFYYDPPYGGGRRSREPSKETSRDDTMKTTP